MKKILPALICMAWLNSFSQASLNFDGSNDVVNAGINDGLKITGNLTLECWAKLTAINTRQHLICQGIANTDGDAANTNILYLFSINAAKTLQLFMEYGSSGSNVVPVSTAAADVNVGEWHHYAVVRDSSAKTVDFYVDGVKLGNTVSYATNPTGGLQSYFSVGGAFYASGTSSVEYPFPGYIDEVRVWDTTRSQAQIQDHLDCSLTSATHLVLSYNFDNGTSGADNTAISTVADGSGNGFTGTLTNFALTGTTSNFGDNVVTGTPSATATSDATGNTITAGEEVTFTAQGVSAGASPAYQWEKNGVSLSGETDDTYVTSDLADGDSVDCIITPSVACYSGTVTSNGVKMTVNAALPLQLISFTAVEKNCITTLEWITEEEVNVLSFEVQQSVDGISFSAVQTISATNTSGRNSYRTSIPVAADQTFYRLKMTDIDGAIKYSAVRTVNAVCNSGLFIYPNPVQDEIFIKGAVAGSSYVLCDGRGSVVLQGTLSQPNTSIRVHSLASGIYYLIAGGKSYRIIKD